MNKTKVMEMATSMVAFTGFLVGLFASLYYFSQIIQLGPIGRIMFIVIYLNANLLFLYIMKGLIK